MNQRKIVDIIYLQSIDGPRSLEKQVRAKLSEGWELYGPLIMHSAVDVVQTMVLYLA